MLVTNLTTHPFVLSTGVIIGPSVVDVEVSDAAYQADSSLNQQIDALDAQDFITITDKPSDTFPPESGGAVTAPIELTGTSVEFGNDDSDADMLRFYDVDGNLVLAFDSRGRKGLCIYQDPANQFDALMIGEVDGPNGGSTNLGIDSQGYIAAQGADLSNTAGGGGTTLKVTGPDLGGDNIYDYFQVKAGATLLFRIKPDGSVYVPTTLGGGTAQIILSHLGFLNVPRTAGIGGAADGPEDEDVLAVAAPTIGGAFTAKLLTVRDANSAEVFSIHADGTIHGKTGGSVIFDL